MSSNQTSVQHIRDATSSPCSSWCSCCNKKAKNRFLTAMRKPGLDRIHLLLAFCPFLPYQGAKKLTSYFSRAELKEGSARESYH